MLPDCSQLNGKRFITSRGAIAEFTVLGPGGVSIAWICVGPETAADREEAERWIMSQMGLSPENVAISQFLSSERASRVTAEELAIYREFVKKHG